MEIYIQIGRNILKNNGIKDPLAFMYEHIHHFSEKSLETLAIRCGIKIDKKICIPGSTIAILGYI